MKNLCYPQISMAQLVLPLETKMLLDFEHFHPSENAFTVASLQNWPENEWFIFLQGLDDSGKTHLAEALAGQMLSQGKKALYLSAKHPAFYSSLEHIDFADIMIIDNFDLLFPAAAANEEQLFSFYNRCLEKKSLKLLLLSRIKANELPIQLKDLSSRLQNGLQLYLKPIRDDALIDVILCHEQRLSLNLSPEIRDYLLNHLPRSPKILVSSLEKLAAQSLQDKRRLTLPYIKQVLLL